MRRLRLTIQTTLVFVLASALFMMAVRAYNIDLGWWNAMGLSAAALGMAWPVVIFWWALVDGTIEVWREPWSKETTETEQVEETKERTTKCQD